MTIPENLKVLLEDRASPRWLKEVYTFLSVKSQFVLWGNIRDKFAYPRQAGQYDLLTIHEYLTDALHAMGYQATLLVDPIHGITLLDPTPESNEDGRKSVHLHRQAAAVKLNELTQAVDGKFAENASLGGRVHMAAEFPAAVVVAEALAGQPAFPIAILFNYLMGFVSSQGGEASTGETATAAFIRSLIVSYDARPNKALRLFNPIFWLCDRENELPAWLALNNPRIRSISVGRPDAGTRRLICHSQLAWVEDFGRMSAAAQKTVIDDYVAHTDGLTLNDIAAIANFRVRDQLAVQHIADAARRYKLGITEDPWKAMAENDPKGFLLRMHETLNRRVKGQPHAIEKAVTIVRKALRGVAGAQAGGSNRPKGVLFLAGPTGTGKTELAKSLTEALFYDERAYIRFDMSEFSAEHSDQRLLGAPPGYVGFEAGGELTRAVREKPCAVILFDEIEKANERLWDKFLAILDDGQLTSGKGERVYFSESIIVFTSNLGMTRVNSEFRASAELPSHAELTRVVNEEIDRFFAGRLNRPELRNRLGDNIVVFDFIREDSARAILQKQLDLVLKRVKEREQIDVVIAGREDAAPGTAMATLIQECCGNLLNGGRGIGNRLDTVFIGPLTAWIDAHEPKAGAVVRIKRIQPAALGRFEIEAEV
jgi:hypothetical protein